MATPKLQHVALAVQDPVRTAEYYKTVFGMTELNRRPDGDGKDGVWLTDGYMYFAVLPIDRAGAPLPGGSGIHHIGFTVDDLAGSTDAMEGVGATECTDSTPANRKYQDSDGIVVDLRAAERRFWDKRVSAAAELYSLVPASDLPEPITAEDR